MFLLLQQFNVVNPPNAINHPINQPWLRTGYTIHQYTSNIPWFIIIFPIQEPLIGIDRYPGIPVSHLKPSWIRHTSTWPPTKLHGRDGTETLASPWRWVFWREVRHGWSLSVKRRWSGDFSTSSILSTRVYHLSIHLSIRWYLETLPPRDM